MNIKKTIFKKTYWKSTKQIGVTILPRHIQIVRYCRVTGQTVAHHIFRSVTEFTIRIGGHHREHKTLSTPLLLARIRRAPRRYWRIVGARCRRLGLTTAIVPVLLGWHTTTVRFYQLIVVIAEHCWCFSWQIDRNQWQNSNRYMFSSTNGIQGRPADKIRFTSKRIFIKTIIFLLNHSLIGARYVGKQINQKCRIIAWFRKYMHHKLTT